MTRGVVVWFTGLPASGKTTLAARVQRRLGGAAVLLDSDALRTVLGMGAYTPRARARFYRVLGELAAALARQGLVVLVAATAARRAYRAAARAAAPRFLEVWVRTPLAECARRDPKGLYARARRGGATTLPGAGARYEAPLAPELVAEGGRDRRAVAAIVARLGRRTASARRLLHRRA